MPAAEQLVTQRGANNRRKAEEAAAAGAIETAAQAEREQLLAETRATTTRVTGEAEGAAETARMAAYDNARPELLLALRLDARKIGGRGLHSGVHGKTTSVSEVRAWAKGQGFKLGDRGRLPLEVWAAWEKRIVTRSVPKPRVSQVEANVVKAEELQAGNARIDALEQTVAELAARVAAFQARAAEPRKRFDREG